MPMHQYSKAVQKKAPSLRALMPMHQYSKAVQKKAPSLRGGRQADEAISGFLVNSKPNPRLRRQELQVLAGVPEL